MTAQPIRVQLRRTKGWRMPPNTVKVDRTTRWGNDFVMAHEGTRALAVADVNARNALDRISSLDSRVTEIERKLNM